MQSYNVLREMFLAAIDEARTEAKLTNTPHSVVDLPGLNLIAVPPPMVTVTPDDPRSDQEVMESWYDSQRKSGP